MEEVTQLPGDLCDMLLEEPAPSAVKSLTHPLGQFAQCRRGRRVTRRRKPAATAHRRALRETADDHATQAGGLRRHAAGRERRTGDGECDGADAVADDAGNHEGPPVRGVA